MSLANYYLELDSTFRDRQSWPNPGNFEAILASSRGSTSGNAEGANRALQSMADPVSQSEPVNAWTSGLFNVNLLGSNNISGQIENINIGHANSATVIEFKATTFNLLQQLKNYYRNAVLRNVTNQTLARISEYIYMGNNRGQITLYDDFSTFAYNFGDLIEICDPTDFTDSSNSFLFVPTGSKFNQNYFKKLIYNETLAESRVISNYDTQTNLIKISNPSIETWTTQDNYSIRDIEPNFTFPIDPFSTNSQIIISGPAAVSDVNNTYLTWYIRIPKIIYNTIDTAESRRIVNYDAVTKIATVNPAFSSLTGLDTGLARRGASLRTELMQYSYDNANPLNWSSSLSQEAPLYAIKLRRLVLPNQILAVGTGSKPSYQPYFYVELSSGDPWSPFYNIYSNNPNAVHAIFRATVKDIKNLETSQFIALEGDDMTQIMRFRLDSTIQIKISIPSTGQTFTTVMSDTIAPSAPNPAVQINALFEFAPL